MRSRDSFRHPISAAEREAVHLYRVASEGRSEATPLILVGTWLVILVPLVSLVIALAILVAHLIAR
jgi:hypothetical protein